MARIDRSLAIGADRTIDVDRKRLTRALLELIDNAIKFTPPHGSVRVSAEPVGTSFVFEVTDSGVGVDERDRARSLQPFVQADGRVARAKRVPENPATIAHTTVSLVRKGSCLEPRCCARAGTSWLSRKTHKFLNKRILVLACLLVHETDRPRLQMHVRSG